MFNRKLILLTVLLLACRASGQVVLSEIMFDALENEFHDEFLELVNLSDVDPVDLTGWQLSDGSGVDEIVAHEAGLILQPGQFAVILDLSYFDNSSTYDDLIPASGLILTIDNNTFGSRGLSNSTPETVSLLNASGEVVSQYTYSLGNPPGFSDEKVDLFGENNAANWRDSKIVHGTPGGPNSVSPLEHDLAVRDDGIVFEPASARMGESVLISAKIFNVGLRTAQSFATRFFDDINGNGEPDAGEMLGEPFQHASGLAVGDSVTFFLEYSNVAAGTHLVFVQIDYPADQDATNNTAGRELLVGAETMSVRISEIMYAPQVGQPEWVEVTNTSGFEVNLKSWALSDSRNELSFVNNDVILQPEGHFVLSQDSSLLDIFNVPNGAFVTLSRWPALNNDFDSLRLFDVLGHVIDEVNYSSSWGGARGISLEKINPALSANDSSNWSSSVAAAGGTPGLQNSIHARSLPSETELVIEPNPFSPDGDGRDDVALITYRLPVTTSRVNVKIYDLRGRHVRFLANNQPSGSENSIIWDGRDDAGRLARMGIYVVFLQALNASAGVLMSDKGTVVLAGKL